MGQPLGAIGFAQDQIIVAAIKAFVEIGYADDLTIGQSDKQILLGLFQCDDSIAAHVQANDARAIQIDRIQGALLDCPSSFIDDVGRHI